MNDPAYKSLFSRPRVVRDLLSGFAARYWSAELDLGKQGDPELTVAFTEWGKQVLLPRFRGSVFQSLFRYGRQRRWACSLVSRSGEELWMRSGCFTMLLPCSPRQRDVSLQIGRAPQR